MFISATGTNICPVFIKLYIVLRSSYTEGAEIVHLLTVTPEIPHKFAPTLLSILKPRISETCRKFDIGSSGSQIVGNLLHLE